MELVERDETREFETGDARQDPSSTQPTSREKGAEQMRAKLQRMQDLEAERDRLEKEAATQPVGK